MYASVIENEMDMAIARESKSIWVWWKKLWSDTIISNICIDFSCFVEWKWPKPNVCKNNFHCESLPWNAMQCLSNPYFLRVLRKCQKSVRAKFSQSFIDFSNQVHLLLLPLSLNYLIFPVKLWLVNFPFKKEDQMWKSEWGDVMWWRVGMALTVMVVANLQKFWRDNDA